MAVYRPLTIRRLSLQSVPCKYSTVQCLNRQSSVHRTVKPTLSMGTILSQDFYAHHHLVLTKSFEMSAVGCPSDMHESANEKMPTFWLPSRPRG